ncbi:MAG: acyltransferase [Candidatus Izemoplasmatales bacterium]|nr:acyltransferase [Candidatus Izemoplasmatales bacterium]
MNVDNRIIKSPFAFLKNKRNILIDLLKLIALLMVILDHSLQRWVLGIQNTQMYNFIFLTQMPLFMFLAGFLFCSSPNNKTDSIAGLFSFVLKILISFLLPFAVFSLIKSAVQASVYNENFFVLLIDKILHPDNSLWFLWVLFWIEIIYSFSYFLSKKIHNNLGSLVLFICILILLTLAAFCLYKVSGLFATKLICYYMFFFSLGYCFYYLFPRIKIFFSIERLIIVLMGSAFLLIIVMFLHPCFIFEKESALNIFIRILGSCLSITCLSIIVYFVSLIPKIQFVAAFGQLSLEFYVTHLMLFLIPCFQTNITNPLLFCLAYLLVVFATFVCIMIFKSLYLFDFLLYGKHIFCIKKPEEKQNIN